MCRLCVSVCVVFVFLRYLRFLVGNLPKASTRTSNSTNNINCIRVAEQSERDKYKCLNWQEQEKWVTREAYFCRYFNFQNNVSYFRQFIRIPIENNVSCSHSTSPSVCVCVCHKFDGYILCMQQIFVNIHSTACIQRKRRREREARKRALGMENLFASLTQLVLGELRCITSNPEMQLCECCLMHLVLSLLCHFCECVDNFVCLFDRQQNHFKRADVVQCTYPLCMQEIQYTVELRCIDYIWENSMWQWCLLTPTLFFSLSLSHCIHTDLIRQ